MLDAVLDAGTRPRLGRVRVPSGNPSGGLSCEPLPRDPALAVGGRARRLVAALAAADRHQRARDHPLPARADRLVRGRRRRVGRARARLGDRRARAGPARGPDRRAPRPAARSRSCTRSRSARSSASPSSTRPPSVLLLCGFVGGFAIPPTSSVLRSMWTDLLEPRLHQAAYALDSHDDRADLHHRPAADRGDRGDHLARRRADRLGGRGRRRHGDLHRAPADAARRERGGAPAHRGLLGALASPGVRTLVITSLPAGVGIGMLEVGIPAFSRAEGAAATRGRAARDLVLREPRRRPGLRDRSRAARCTARTWCSTAVLPLTLLPLAARAGRVGDGAARAPGGLLHRAAARDPQRARRRRRPARHADRGLHVADHVVRRRHRGRRGARAARSSRARAGGRRS